MATIVLIIRQLTIFALRKLVQILLPIPLFPEVSKTLAKLVGVNPLSLKPVPKFPKFPTSGPLSSAISNVMHKADLTNVHPLPEAYQQVSAWTQRHLLAASIHTRPRPAPEPEPEPEEESPRPSPPPKSPRKKVKDIDFEAPIKALDSLSHDAVDEITHSMPPVSIIPPLPPVFRKKTPPPPPPENHPEHDEPTDAAYARLSAEKQVYEQSQQTSPKHPSNPPTPPPKPPIASPKSTSTESSLYLGPTAGEVFSPPVLITSLPSFPHQPSQQPIPTCTRRISNRMEVSRICTSQDHGQ